MNCIKKNVAAVIYLKEKRRQKPISANRSSVMCTHKTHQTKCVFTPRTASTAGISADSDPLSVSIHKHQPVHWTRNK